ncbi:MAG: DUF362 domain-containing protein [Candidatus Firestonebacteria bacterium]|nr:DUF362 domain-containing protein [Candidatus Firestonebacteria bacterium]
MPEVIIRKCESYDSALLKKTAVEIFEALGGVNAIYKKGSRVAVKVNLILGSAPETAVTTNPFLVRAFCDLLLEKGVNPFIIDSPNAAIMYNPESLKQVYALSGYPEIFKENKTEFNYDCSFESVSIKDGVGIKQAEILTPILKCDGVLNLAKGKTHAFTQVTGATKNLFGCIAGMYKGAYHTKLQNVANFSKMLVDIAVFIKPALSVIDAVTCMEGNGPSGGEPREVGYIIASKDTFHADSVFCSLIGLAPEAYPVLIEAAGRGIFKKEELKLNGSYEKVKGFKLADTAASTIDGFVGINFKTRIFRALAKQLFTVRPVMNSKCIGCAACAKACPVKAIDIVNKKAIIRKKDCIRCYCCHEVCPHRAVDLKKNLLFRMREKIIK